MMSVLARVPVFDEELRAISKTFTRSPIRIGRHKRSDVGLRHPRVARSQGEIVFGRGKLAFRNLAWVKKVWIDGHRVARGEMVPLLDNSVIVIGPFKISVTLRKTPCRYDYHSRKVTPLVLRRLSVEELDESYASVETSPQTPLGRPPADQVLRRFAGGLLAIHRSMPRDSRADLPAFQDSDELVSYLLDPTASTDRLEGLDDELTRIAGQIAIHPCGER